MLTSAELHICYSTLLVFLLISDETVVGEVMKERRRRERERLII